MLLIELQCQIGSHRRQCGLTAGAPRLSLLYIPSMRVDILVVWILVDVFRLITDLVVSEDSLAVIVEEELALLLGLVRSICRSAISD